MAKNILTCQTPRADLGAQAHLAPRGIAVQPDQGLALNQRPLLFLRSVYGLGVAGAQVA